MSSEGGGGKTKDECIGMVQQKHVCVVYLAAEGSTEATVKSQKTVCSHHVHSHPDHLHPRLLLRL